MSRQVIRDIAELVQHNWRDEETDYNGAALEDGNSREGHVFERIMRIQKWLEEYHGYPHVEPWIKDESE